VIYCPPFTLLCVQLHRKSIKAKSKWIWGKDFSRWLQWRSMKLHLHGLIPTSSHHHGRRNDFFQGGATVDFSKGGEKDGFQWGSTVVKFHFSSSKLRGQLFSTKNLITKYQISDSMGGGQGSSCYPVPHACSPSVFYVAYASPLNNFVSLGCMQWHN